ncbi:putative leader peptide [Pseudonocardia autotrophica]
MTQRPGRTGCAGRSGSVTLADVNWPLTRRRAVDLCRLAGCLCLDS